MYLELWRFLEGRQLEIRYRVGWGCMGAREIFAALGRYVWYGVWFMNSYHARGKKTIITFVDLFLFFRSAAIAEPKLTQAGDKVVPSLFLCIPSIYKVVWRLVCAAHI